MKKQTAVIIGRFQPFHAGHAELIDHALRESEKVVIVLGSACGARSLRNPFTTAEREELIKLNLKDSGRVQFVGVRDYFYNDNGWINEVREKVKSLAISEVVLFGHQKDVTSGYLSWFSDWRYQESPCYANCNATGIREAYLRDKKAIVGDGSLSEATRKWLLKFAETEAYLNLHAEQLDIDSYRKSWASAPYPPVFVTTDILVVCAGHILLIQRKHMPGKGMWANPGGFLDPYERILNCALRELEEETKLDVPVEELLSSLEKVQVFDHPLRSSRGRTITHAHLFKLKRTTLPNVRASDDAAAVKWVPLLDIGKMESEFFEDHFHIISLLR